MKYIRPVSDLHLEAFYGKDTRDLADLFIPSDPRDAESLLILAGDISSKPDQLANFLGALRFRFQEIVFVPGNHEFYRNEMTTWPTYKLADGTEQWPKFPDNVLCSWLQVAYKEYSPELRVIAGTLWANGQNPYLVEQALNDFYIIKYNGERFTVKQMVEIHDRHKKLIESYLKQPFAGKTVVVTHHLPSFRLCHPRFGSEINGGFAGNCDYLFQYANYWVYGHTHDTQQHIWNNCHLICNPAGYKSEYRSAYNDFQKAPLFVELK